MPGSSLNPSQCLLDDSPGFDKLNLKYSGSAVSQYCNSGISTVQLFSHGTNEDFCS